MKALFILPLFGLFAGSISAQEPLNIDRLRAEYPGNHAVVEFDHYRAEISSSSGKLSIVTEHREQWALLGESAPRFSEWEESSAPSYKLVSMKGYSLNPKTKGFKREKIAEIAVTDESEPGIFAHEYRLHQTRFKGLVSGSRIYKSTQYQIEKPQHSGKMFIGGSLPNEEVRFEIETSKDVELGFHWQNAEGYTVNPQIREDKNKRYYLWTFSKVPVYSYGGSNEPDPLWVLPHLVYWVKSYEQESRKVNVIGSIDDLHRYYCGFQKKVQMTPDPSIRAIADSISRVHQKEEDRVEASFRWVQKHISYIAIVEGDGGFQSQDPEFTCSKRYGDCKAMSTLQQSICSAMGIPLSLAWTGTTELPYFYTRLPSTTVDNHMIAVYEQEGRNVLLDATYSRLPYGYTPPFIQGKEILISRNCTSWKVDTARVEPASRNRIVDRIKLRFDWDKGDLYGKGSARFTGYQAMEVQDALGRVKNPEEETGLVRSFVLKGDNNFELHKYQVLPQTFGDSVVVIEYEFKLPNWMLRLENARYFKPDLEKRKILAESLNERRSALVFDQSIRRELHLEFEAGHGLENAELLGEESFEIQGVRYTRKMERLGKSITYTQRLDLERSTIQPEDLAELSVFQQKVRKLSNQNVRFEFIP